MKVILVSVILSANQSALCHTRRVGSGNKYDDAIRSAKVFVITAKIIFTLVRIRMTAQVLQFMSLEDLPWIKVM